MKKLNEFLEENKDITVLGFAWSMYWRIMLLIYGIMFILALLVQMFN